MWTTRVGTSLPNSMANTPDSQKFVSLAAVLLIVAAIYWLMASPKEPVAEHRAAAKITDVVKNTGKDIRRSAAPQTQ